MNKYDDRLRDEIYERVSWVDKTEVYKRLHNAFVRWYDGKDITTVCRDHYPAVYKTYPKALAVDDLRDYQIKLDQLRGTIAVSVGTADNSKLLDALSSDADLQVLGISLYGLKDRKDFATIKDMVYKSSIPSVNLSIDVATYMPCFHSKLFRLKKRIDVHLARFDRSRFDPLLELMQHPKLKSVNLLRLPRKFFCRTSLDLTYPNLTCLGLDWASTSTHKHSHMKIVDLVSRIPNLSTLHLYVEALNSLVAYNSLPALPGSFTIRLGPWIVIPGSSSQPRAHAKFKDFSELVRSYGSPPDIIAFRLDKYSPVQDEHAIALAFATSKGRVIETLSYSYHDLGEDGSKHVAEIVAQNPLVKLKYAMRRDSDLAVLKAIRWECLMGLKITFGGGCPPEATDVLSGIVEANNSVVRLNTFKLSAFDVVNSKDMSAVLSIVSLLSVVKLDITMRFNGDQAAAILESVNFSRLRVLDFGRMNTIWTADETAKVLDILDRRLIILEEIQMYSATLTEEQMDKLRAKGLERIHVSQFS